MNTNQLPASKEVCLWGLGKTVWQVTLPPVEKRWQETQQQTTYGGKPCRCAQSVQIAISVVLFLVSLSSTFCFITHTRNPAAHPQQTAELRQFSTGFSAPGSHLSGNFRVSLLDFPIVFLARAFPKDLPPFPTLWFCAINCFFSAPKVSRSFHSRGIKSKQSPVCLCVCASAWCAMFLGVIVRAPRSTAFSRRAAAC